MNVEEIVFWLIATFTRHLENAEVRRSNHTKYQNLDLSRLWVKRQEMLPNGHG